MSDRLALSPRQQEIFELAQSGAHRLILVSAGPGSGKTRLFVKTLEHCLDDPPALPGGVAALSFTNAASDVISSRLNVSVGAPHFLGTLDAFMLRFVVRPFAHLLGANASGIKLVPEQTAAHLSGHYKRAYGADPRDKASAFSVSYVGGTEDQPKIEVVGQAAYSKRIAVPTGYVGAFMTDKHAEWSGHGRVTHADTHYLAALILLHPTHGPAVCAILSRRFPILLVDELQDTSHFLGRALVALLRGCRFALLVGDQDQGIYEFAGANASALFTEIASLSGAHLEELKTSHRCPKELCAVATRLSVSRSTILPEDGAATGRAVLLQHSLATPQPDASLMDEIRSLCGTGETLIVLARRSNTVARLEGREPGSGFKHCPFANRVLSSLVRFHAGSGALDDLEGILFETLYAGRRLSGSSLREIGVSSTQWHRVTRSFAAKSLTLLTSQPTWNEWVAFLKVQTKALKDQMPGASLTVRFQGDRANGAKRVGVAQAPAAPRLDICTVHQAKGREYDNVVYFFPKPNAASAPCPSTSWFAQRCDEETRTGFVAATRARQRFILALHAQSVAALEVEAPDFVQLFEKRTVSPSGQPGGG